MMNETTAALAESFRKEMEGGIQEAIRVKEKLLREVPVIARMAATILRALQAVRKIVFFGNGGSAADAQHLAGELAGRFYLDRRPIPAMALSVNSSTITAIANDYGFEHVFARQLPGVVRGGDVALGISTSGNSPNVVLALEQARDMALVTLGFTGRSGGRVKDIVDLCLRVDSDQTARIQEGHILAGHLICEIVERELFGRERKEK